MTSCGTQCIRPVRNPSQKLETNSRPHKYKYCMLYKYKNIDSHLYTELSGNKALFSWTNLPRHHRFRTMRLYLYNICVHIVNNRVKLLSYLHCTDMFTLTVYHCIYCTAANISHKTDLPHCHFYVTPHHTMIYGFTSRDI